jgi:hypothetical protein
MEIQEIKQRLSKHTSSSYLITVLRPDRNNMLKLPFPCRIVHGKHEDIPKYKYLQLFWLWQEWRCNRVLQH